METTNKTLELEAEKQFPLVNIENPSDGVMRGNYDRLKLQQGFIAGATSTYAEKQKLEFAIEYLYLVRNSCFDIENRIQELEFAIEYLYLVRNSCFDIENRIQELEQKLSEL